MVSTAKLPKHILSIDEWKAKHEYTCVWCNNLIRPGKMYVRCVWQEDNADNTVHSHHICVDCWTS